MGEKFYIFLFSIVLLNYFLQVTSNDKIVLPLYYINNSDEITNYIEYLFQPQLYTKIKLGNPEQIIYLLIFIKILIQNFMIQIYLRHLPTLIISYLFIMRDIN